MLNRGGEGNYIVDGFNTVSQHGSSDSNININMCRSWTKSRRTAVEEKQRRAEENMRILKANVDMLQPFFEYWPDRGDNKNYCKEA